MTYEAALRVLLDSLFPAGPDQWGPNTVVHLTALAAALRVEGAAEGFAWVLDALADEESRTPVVAA